jgi:hypothetical protein
VFPFCEQYLDGPEARAYAIKDDNEDRHQALFNLSCKEYPKTLRAKADGNLRVVINDSDAHRWDNLGLFP